MTTASTDQIPRGPSSVKAESRALALMRLKEAGLAVLTLAISGDPAIGFGHQEALVLTLALLLYAPRIIIRRGRWIAHWILACSWFLGIFLIQALSFSFFPASTILGFFLKLLIGFSFMSTLRQPLRAYVDAMCFLVGLSFLFFIPQQIGLLFGADFKQVLAVFRVPLSQSDQFHILVHNFHNLENQHRNAGIFWEPGAFSGYLVLGLILSILLHRRPEDERPWAWSFPWLLMGLLSTQSTTGFLMIPLLLAIKRADRVFAQGNARRVLLRACSTMAGILVIALILFQIPWVGQKFLEQINSSLSGQRGWAITRFGSLLFDLQYIEIRPLTGWGLHGSTRYMLHPYLAEWLGQGQGNGLSDFVAKVGLLGIGYFLWRCFIGFRRLSGSAGEAIMILVVITLTLFGEAFLGYPIFLGLMFLPIATQTSLRLSNSEIAL